jgi:hypothetical protein
MATSRIEKEYYVAEQKSRGSSYQPQRSGLAPLKQRVIALLLLLHRDLDISVSFFVFGVHAWTRKSRNQQNLGITQGQSKR